MLAETDRARGKDPRRTDERRSSAQVSASLPHLDRVRSSLANVDVAETAGAVEFTNKRGRNIQAKPRGACRWPGRQGQTGGRLSAVLIAGTLQGVIRGSVIRVELLPGPRGFDFVVAGVLLPLGLWLALTARPAQIRRQGRVGGSRALADPARHGGGLRRRHLRHRKRLDPGFRTDRHRTASPGGRPRRPGIYFRDLGSRSDHVPDPRSITTGRLHPTVRPGSRWASEAWRARAPVPVFSGVSRTG
jgi:hypothetical protein